MDRDCKLVENDDTSVKKMDTFHLRRTSSKELTELLKKRAKMSQILSGQYRDIKKKQCRSTGDDSVNSVK